MISFFGLGRFSTEYFGPNRTCHSCALTCIGVTCSNNRLGGGAEDEKCSRYYQNPAKIGFLFRLAHFLAIMGGSGPPRGKLAPLLTWLTTCFVLVITPRCTLHSCPPLDDRVFGSAWPCSVVWSASVSMAMFCGMVGQRTQPLQITGGGGEDGEGNCTPVSPAATGGGGGRIAAHGHRALLWVGRGGKGRAEWGFVFRIRCGNRGRGDVS